jgi:G3E family GTPase
MEPDRAAPAGRVPVAVLTGFLGSGKTTLLNRLLKLPALAETAVIVNEYGAIGIDHLLVEHAGERPILIGNGCVCCTLRDDLAAALDNLRRRGAPFRRVVIETTGLAEPAPILHTLLNDADVARAYEPGGITATLDAVAGASTLDRHEEARRQIAAADRLIITKTDIAGTGGAALAARVRAINPGAAILRAADAALGPALLFGQGLPAEMAGEVAHTHAGGNGIATFCLVRDAPVDWDGVKLWLASLAALCGERLLRVKGFVAAAGSPDRPFLVQGVQHVFSPPVQLSSWPSDDHRTRLVFITDGLSRETVEGTLEIWGDFAAQG